MAFELTIDGYTFDNPPSSYRKRIDLGNSPQPHYEKTATPFYRSDSQQITLELSGRLNLNDQGDLDELEKLQAKAIEGGEVDVQFDPFFSGTGVIEDDPFDQENQVGTYSFTIAINEEYTDDSAYPAHATPTTGNTFELGDFDFGFDPSTVSQEYERQTERVDRLQGVAHTSDTKGLVTRVSLEGRVDGGGQAKLWDKARSNALAYLSAEFQNGWALLNSLSVQKDDATPDYLQGLFRYSAEFVIVKDPTSGIGEVSQFINHDVGDSGTYTSDGDSGSGSDEGGLDFKVLGGTGSIDGEYVDWVTTTLTLDDDTTNYVYVYDQNGDGQGTVEYNTNSFGSDVLPLYEVDTSNGEIVDVRNVRDSLLGSGDDTTSDLLFQDEFAIDDTAFSYAQILAFADAVGDPSIAKSYLGLVDLTENFADPVEGPIQALGKADLTETITFDDGGSATGAGGGASGSKEWGTAADWDAALAESGVVHESFGDHAADVIEQGYPSTDSGLVGYWPLDEAAGSSTATDVSGNNNDGSNNGGDFDQTGVCNTTGWRNGGDDNIEVSDSSELRITGDITFSCWFYRTAETVGWDGLLSKAGGASVGYSFFINDDNPDKMATRIDGDNYLFGFTPSKDTWYHACFRLSGSTATLKIDGGNTHDEDISAEGLGSTSSGSLYIGANSWNATSDCITGTVEEPRLWNRALSDSEMVDQYLGSGSLTTDWKSFSGNVDLSSLKLENVQATLNGETATVYVESDPNDDGSADEVSDAITLDGSGGPYSVTGLSTSDEKFRLRIEFSRSSPTSSAQFNSADLTASSSTEPDQNPNTTWEIRGAIYETSGNEYEGGGVVSKYGA